MTVTITGVSDAEFVTGGNGQYAFSGLRAGNYTVEISGFDEEDVAFGSVASTEELAVGESRIVPFEGTYLRTSGITGQVTVGNNPLPNVTVSIQGRGEERTETTNGAGTYTVSELRSGDYSVGITNPDADEYGFDVTSKTVFISHGETGNASFDGILLRTAGIMGTVTVDGVGGIPGVTVSVQGEGEELEKTTNAAGQVSFDKLHEGTYSIGITGFDDDLYGFNVTTTTVTVALETTVPVPFEGIMLRTAGIDGTVTVEGHAIPGVTVTVTGGPKDEEHTRTTNDAGYYNIGELHSGTYAVAISDFDANEYEFEATVTSIFVAPRTTETVAFQGDLLRTAGISGRVSVDDGTGLDDITVTLSGDADATETTANGGQYAFSGLAAGDYTVAISGWDDVAYDFSMVDTEVDVMGLTEETAAVRNFVGTHTRTASVSGHLFLDEVDGDGSRGEGEPPFAMTAEMMAMLAAAGIPGVPMVLQGPGVNDVAYEFVEEDGSYEFDSLMAGPYRVLINMTDELAAAITGFGFSFTGELTGELVGDLEAGSTATVNFPFRIVMQTIIAGAVMGNAETTGLPVAGVTLELYPTVEDADDGTNMLDTATTGELGAARFDFARAADVGPGGQGIDHLVFVKVTGAGHPDLVVSDNANIEVEYAPAARVDNARTAVRLLNTMANFQWWVKSDADATDGNTDLEGWKVVIDGDTYATDADGLATFTGPVAVADLPMTFEIMLDEDRAATADDPAHDADQPDDDERWMQSDMLTYEHTGLEHPAMNMTDSQGHDRGPIYVTWTTQKLTLGVYREADDVEGFTNYQSDLPGGDHRPNAKAGGDMTVRLLVRDDRDRLRLFDEWDHDCDDDGVKEMPTDAKDATGNFAADGMITFDCLPADKEFTVRFDAGSDRVQLDYGYDDIDTFGGDLDFGMPLGAFGDMSGGGPEVLLCSASTYDNSDDWCATFGYQWETGEVYGNVGLEKDHEVTVTAETTDHGATGDDATTDADGEYSIGGLRDGVYSAEAASGDPKYQLLTDETPAEVTDIALYHNEDCWADPGPDNADCSDDEWEEGTDAAGDPTYSYRNADLQAWRTGRLGQSIRGYVANDGQDGEDLDNLLRGDESMAGITMTLLDADDNEVTTTDTEADGYYEFVNLEAGTYTVSAGEASNAVAIHAIAEDDGDWELVTSKTAVAEDYTLTPDDYELNKPYWVRSILATGRIMGHPTTEVEGTGTTPVSDIYYNFALVYKDGEVTGKVTNLSGSEEDIDIIISSPIPLDEDVEVVTSSSGNFELGGLMEAIGYMAVIEDAGFAYPCMNTDGEPDDNLEDGRGGCGLWDHDGDTNTPEILRERFPDSLTADIEGENDHESMGTLMVYRTSASVNDTVRGARVRYRRHSTTVTEYNDTLNAIALGERSDAEPDTTVNSSVHGPISWQSKSIMFVFPADSTPAGAVVDLQAAVGECIGTTCELGFNATGSGVTDNLTDTITVTVTAANGYHDHVYTVMASRQNPYPHLLGAGNITRADTVDSQGDPVTHAATEVSGTDNAFTFTTTGASSVNVVIRLASFGDDASDNAYCAQSVSVRPTGGNALEAMADEADDICPNTRYSLSASAAPGTSYDVVVTSEDGVDKTYSLRVVKGTT